MAKRSKGLVAALERITYDKPEINKTLKSVKKNMDDVQKALGGKKKK